ncbi:hypothetical protein BDQ17DRAFT_1334489 [Cyathus striatus]|nr:hypothetical protein BDQ17DRAFT_1334489 [Cyathus striatus]
MPLVPRFIHRIFGGFRYQFRTWFRYIFTGLTWKTSSGQNKLSMTSGKVTTQGSFRSPVFALVIGIDKYASESVGDIKGAVSSANAVFDYLKKSLGVPDSQIQILCDEDATRENIMNELLSIRDRRNIISGDPIIIYFAGHGNMGIVRDGTAEGQKVEMILPFDTGLKSSRKQTYGIPASTISMILEDISNIKGDNIYLILDCDFESQGRALPASLDADLWKNHNACGFNHSTNSFISGIFFKYVVATAGNEEVTQQKTWRCGALTKGLVSRLTDLKTLNISYYHLYGLLSGAQVIHVAGNIETRQLFDGKVSKNTYMPIEFNRVFAQSTNFELEAGIEDGVRLGSLYNAYSSLIAALNGSKTCGSMVVSRFTPESSILYAQDMTEELDVGYAVLKEESSKDVMHLHVSDDLVPTLESAIEPEKLKIVSESNAILSLSYQDNVLKIDIMDNRVTECGLDHVEIECDLNIQYIQHMFKGIAHYHHILNRASDITTDQIVSVDLYNLTVISDRFTTGLRPYRVEHGPSMVVDGVADVKASRSVPYGIKISNHTSLDLYAYLFFMDNYDFSIMSYYLSDGNNSSRLEANKSIKIGYEDSEHPPVIYYLRPGVSLEVGFIKLFVSTEPLDMTHVQQDSPLQMLEQINEGRFIDNKKIWGTATAKIVQLPPDSEYD